MSQELDTSFECNRLIWLTSVPKEEQGPSRRIVEDITSWAESISLDFHHEHILSESHLIEVLNVIEFECTQNNVKPIIHFYMHGDTKRGLYIAETASFISWEIIVDHFQKINFATRNNLTIVLASCFGLNLIRQIRLKNPVPFFILLAPSSEVTVGYLEDNLVKFYTGLFDSGSIDYAFSTHISDHFTYLHCEKLLFSAISAYIKSNCIGKSARERREYLLTDIINRGMPKTKANLNDARKKIRKGLLPDSTILDKYVSTFLIGKTCSFTIDDFYERFQLRKNN